MGIAPELEDEIDRLNMVIAHRDLEINTLRTALRVNAIRAGFTHEDVDKVLEAAWKVGPLLK